MRRVITTLALVALVSTAAAQSFENAGREVIFVDDLPMSQRWRTNEPRSIFSNFGASLDAGLTGFGISAATPLGKYFNLRAGVNFMPLPVKYSTSEGDSFDVGGLLQDQGVDMSQVTVNTYIDYEIDATVKLNNAPSGHVMVDYSPTKRGYGAFHITAGLYFGGRDIIHLHGDSNPGLIQQNIDSKLDEIYTQFPELTGMLDVDITDLTLSTLGDAGIHLNADGTADAYARVNKVRPYFGIGWGNAIPRGRVGFRFDIGAVYQGRPDIVSPNTDMNIVNEINDKDLNKILGYARFFPQLSVSLTFRILNDN